MATASPYRPKTTLEYYESIKSYLIARTSRLSNFNVGSRLRTLIEGLAAQLAESDREAYNGFVAAVRESTYKTFSFQRLPGVQATGILRIEHSGHASPEVYNPFEIDLFGQVFETIEVGTIPVGETFIDVQARAKEAGESGNITTASIDTDEGQGTPNVTLTSGTRVFNPSAFTGGTDQESDADRLGRFQIFVQSFARSTPGGILSGALSVAGVVGAVVTSNTNPTTGNEETGWVNVYITDGTSSPPQSLVDEVADTIAGVSGDPDYPGYAAAGTRVFVGAIDVQAVDVTYALILRDVSDLTDAEAVAIADSAVINYVNTLPIGEDALLETIEATLLLAHPDFLRVTVSVPAANIVVASNALARIGGAGGGTLSGSVSGRETPA